MSFFGMESEDYGELIEMSLRVAQRLRHAWKMSTLANLTKFFNPKLEENPKITQNSNLKKKSIYDQHVRSAFTHKSKIFRPLKNQLRKTFV